MRWPLALLVAALGLVGCQSSQSPSNPFLRTTVPPPATGAAVAPDSGYYPPATQPGAPQVLPGAPSTVPPPSNPAPQDKFSPPGGSYQYHQSGIDRSKVIAPSGPEQRTRGMAIARREKPRPAGDNSSAPATSDIILTAAKSAQPVNSMAKAGTADSGVVTAVHEVAADSSNSGTSRVTLATALDSSSSDMTAGDSDAKPANRSTIRILPSEPKSAGAAASSGASQSFESSPVERPFRVTVGRAPGALDGAPPGRFRQSSASNWSSAAQRATAPDGSVSEPAAESAGGSQRSEAASPATSSARSAYAYAPDYQWLRGRLEYSQAARRWKLRYIPIDGQTDSFGGSVVLPNSSLLDEFKAGDFVSATGTVQQGTEARGFSPAYQLAHVESQSR